MAGFFSTDSKLYRFMCRLTDVLKLNLLWIIFSLPVVTLGISTIAASAVSLKIAEGQEGYIARDFIKAFKENWKQGIPMSFITLICIWTVYLDFQLFNKAEEHEVMFLIIGIVAAYLFTFSLLYVYPLLARYENTIFNSLKNSFQNSDVVMRLGGDEFAVFACDILEESAAVSRIENFFRSIEAIDIPELGDHKIYISLGAAFKRRDDGENFDSLYRDADSCTYESKKTQGNTYTFHK